MMPPARPAAPVLRTPSRDDHETPRCPVCQRSFTPAGRQAYCSPRCRKTAFRRRHSGPRAPVIVPAARPRSRYTIYECPGCGQRQAGQQRCDDCGIFGRRIGTGGPCPHCSEPVTISDLLDSA
jgi:predicted amidophosphoribosyltransferase